jgi:hypothetical protein
MHSLDLPFCAETTAVAAIAEATKMLYDAVDCPNCLRRAIAEAEERARGLSELLAKVEGT